MTSVGVREFRAGLSDYMTAGEPVRVTRNGQVVGMFVPVASGAAFDAEAFLLETDRMRQALAQAGVEPDEIVREFDERRHTR